jgi:hypothetical protein
VGRGDAEFEPETAGQQSGALPLSHHAFQRATTLSLCLYVLKAQGAVEIFKRAKQFFSYFRSF